MKLSEVPDEQLRAMIRDTEALAGRDSSSVRCLRQEMARRALQKPKPASLATDRQVSNAGH
jgi:hypothetical protein